MTRFLTSGGSDRRALRARRGVGVRGSQAAHPPRTAKRISSRRGKSRAEARRGAGLEDYGACRGLKKLLARRAGPRSGVGGDNWLGSERRWEAAWREERAFSRGGTGRPWSAGTFGLHPLVAGRHFSCTLSPSLET